MNNILKSNTKVMNIITCLLMIFTCIQVNVNAEAEKAKTIIALDSITTEYTVDNGTAEDTIGLPSTLSATVETTDRSNNKTNSTELLAVTWKCDNYDAVTAGTYSFSSTLNDASYTISSSVSMPKASVTVKEADMMMSAATSPMLLGASENMGDAYVAGNGNVSAMGLIPVQTTIPSNSTSSVVSKAGLALKNGSSYTGFKTVDVSYEYLVKRYTTSGGEVNFSDANGTWLSDFKREIVTDSNNIQYWRIRGHHLYSSGQIIPGEVQESIIMNNLICISGDTFIVKGKSWLTLDGEDTAVETTSPIITISSAPYYDLSTPGGGFNNDSRDVISGYYNKTTGKYYGTLAEKTNAGDTNAVYGRVFLFTTYLDNTDSVGTGTGGNLASGGEFFDGSKQITWDMNYSVSVTDVNNNVSYATGEYAPSLIDSRICEKTAPINGYVNGFDTTLNGYISSWNAYNFANPESIVGTDNNQTVNNKVVYSTTKKDGYHYAMTRSLIFVPLNDADLIGTKRVLTVSLSNLNGTGQSGQSFTDSLATNNTYNYTVNPRSKPGNLSQELGYINMDIHPIGDSVWMYPVLHVASDSIADMQINAVDQLVKLDADAFKITGEHDSADEFGGKSTRTVLYGTKKDGTNWANQSEQFSAKKEDLLWYDSVDKIPQGSKIVAVLNELRGGPMTDTNLGSWYKATTIKMGTYVAALSTEIWSGTNVNTVTYTGTNGASLPSMSAPSTGIYSSSAGNYIKTVWEDGKQTVVDPTGDTYGRTWCITGYSISGVATTVMNGTKPGTVGVTNKDATGSAFTISNGERVVAMASQYSIKWLGGTETTDPEHVLHFGINSLTNANGPWQGYWNDVANKYFKQSGDVYIASTSATVTWDETTKSFKSSDSSFKKIEDLTDIEVTGGGEFVLYYKIDIGNTTDLSQEPAAGQYDVGSLLYVNDKSISELSGSQHSGLTHWAWAQGFPTILKNSLIGVSKTPLSVNYAPGESLGWSIASTTAKTDVPSYTMLDVLPYVGDGRGTNVDSSMFTLNNDQITMLISSGESQINSQLKLYYTFDTAVRTAGAGGVIPAASTIGTFDPASSLNSSWKEMTATELTGGTATSKTYTYSLDAADAGKTPTAIVVAGMFGKNEMYYMSLKFDQKNTKTDAVYGNLASIDAPSLYEHNINSGVSKVQPVTRTITGTAWEDVNHDNLMGKTDKKLENILVHLYTADGAEVTKDAYGNDYGTLVTDANGKYEFANPADSTNGWYVTYDLTEAQKEEYIPSAIHTTGDDSTSAADSDFKAETTGTETAYKTNVFKMSSYADMITAGTLSDTSAHDFGLQPATPVDVTLSGTKTLTEDGIAKAITADQFKFTAKAATTNDTTGYTGFTDGDHNVKEDGSFDINTNGNDNKITFTKSGSYTFTVTEKNQGAAGYTYDNKPVTVNIAVTRDDTNNSLKAAVTYSKNGNSAVGIIFANTYQTPEPVKASLSGTKKLTENGKEKTVEAGQFTFTEKADAKNDAAGTKGFASDTAEVKTDGTFTFGDITFTKVGTYSFIVTENDAKAAGYTYDASSYVITYSVALNKTSNTFEVTQLITKNAEDAEAVEFDNTYKTPDPVTVKVDGIKKLNEKQTGIKAGQFTFNLEADKTNPITGYTMPKELKTIVTDQGTFSFGEMVFIMPGTYQFKVTEDVLGEEGYTYDGDAVYVTYQVSLNKTTNQYDVETTYKKGNQEVDAVEFHNTFTPVYKAPDTGDKTSLMFFGMTLLAAFAAIVGILYIKKKYEN